MIVALSGNLCSGKSTLASLLAEKGFSVASTRQALRAMFLVQHPATAERSPTRDQLISYGQRLDEKTRGEWIGDYFSAELLQNSMALLDSARSLDQVRSLKQRFGSVRKVVHLHLHADLATLQQRFVFRNENNTLDEQTRGEEFRHAMSHLLEAEAGQLMKHADAVIDTAMQTQQEVFRAAQKVLVI